MSENLFERPGGQDHNGSGPAVRPRVEYGPDGYTQGGDSWPDGTEPPRRTGLIIGIVLGGAAVLGAATGLVWTAINDGRANTAQPAATVAATSPAPSPTPLDSAPTATEPVESSTPRPPAATIAPPDGPLADPGSLPGADFGFLREVLVQNNRITLYFDRAQILTGAAREAWAAEHGEPDNDVVIVNDNARLRTFVLARRAVIYGSVALAGEVEAREMTRAEFLDSIAEQGESLDLPVWLFHNTRGTTGPVVYLQEQYLP